MDFIENRTRNIAAMALDGLYERSKAISANTANVLTPGYQRRVVSFEDSLQDIIKRENEKEGIKLQNSTEYQKNPNKILYGQTPEQIAFMNTEINKDYTISIDNDMSDAIDTDGNNVNIEEEMMDEAKTGMQYQVVANLLSKSYTALSDVIRNNG